MTHELIFKLPKESYSIAIGPCSAKSRKCKEFIAKNEDVGMKFLISTKDDTGKTGKMSLCKDNNGQDECTTSYTVQSPVIYNDLFNDSFKYVSVLLDHDKGHFTRMRNEFDKYDIDYTVMDDGETQNVLSEDFMI
ncbi:hypothetical protein [Wolbachia endosymbiont (group B) of Episyrphus balteatus]|uniref:hypothetical protein n=1 Tax=Wolbachia endosymbiont (group B) of Episyrphus balteatus TaxID=2954009 RepID=UPI0022279E9F|nr:hypothetical protein [Wolbachia endosymbiont (group B) of Episyrphus balteatus]